LWAPGPAIFSGFGAGWVCEEKAVEAVEKYGGLEGFAGQGEGVSLVPCFFEDFAVQGLPGEKEHLAIRAHLGHAGSELHAVHLGHEDVRYQQVRGERSCGFKSLEGMSEVSGVVSLCLDDCCEGYSDALFIVDDVDDPSGRAFLMARNEVKWHGWVSSRDRARQAQGGDGMGEGADAGRMSGGVGTVPIFARLVTNQPARDADEV